MEKQSYRDRLVSLDKASVDTVEEFCKKHNMPVVIRGKNTEDREPLLPISKKTLLWNLAYC